MTTATPPSFLNLHPWDAKFYKSTDFIAKAARIESAHNGVLVFWDCPRSSSIVHADEVSSGVQSFQRRPSCIKCGGRTTWVHIPLFTPLEPERARLATPKASLEQAQLASAAAPPAPAQSSAAAGPSSL